MELWLFQKSLIISGLIAPIGSVALSICVFILLPMMIFKKTRAVSGTGFIISSYVFGFGLWFFSSAITILFAGIWWLVIGIIFAGIGVVPIAIIACIIKGQWFLGFNLMTYAVLTIGSRYLGVATMAKYYE